MNILPNLKEELKQEDETTAKFIKNFLLGRNDYAQNEINTSDNAYSVIID